MQPCKAFYYKNSNNQRTYHHPHSSYQPYSFLKTSGRHNIPQVNYFTQQSSNTLQQYSYSTKQSRYSPQQSSYSPQQSSYSPQQSSSSPQQSSYSLYHSNYSRRFQNQFQKKVE